MSNQYEVEIIRLHQFFVDWFKGALPNTAEAFTPFSDAMDDRFLIISPTGQAKTCEQIVDSLKAAYGAMPDIEIWIENVAVRRQFVDMAVVTYEEWQKRGNKTTCRLSTVLFKQTPHTIYRLRWLHLHETWLDKPPQT